MHDSVYVLLCSITTVKCYITLVMGSYDAIGEVDSSSKSTVEGARLPRH